LVLSSEKVPEGWTITDKFTMVLDTAGLNVTELTVFLAGAVSMSCVVGRIASSLCSTAFPPQPVSI